MTTNGERHMVALPLYKPNRPENIEPHVRGEALWHIFDKQFQRLDSLLQRVLPPALNPLAQSGAIANTTFIIACVTGVLLLIWYKASVHLAHDSVRQMMEVPWAAGLVRSLHRYSSDACMLFVLLHAFKLFFARRYGGARWLAWVTGIFLVGTLWFVGWIGYWLIWDERARQVALGSAKLLDVLPIFADPLSRSFLIDENINSLLFFVVFFVHMLVPLAMGVALWLHITRLSRPEFLTKKGMTIWVTATLVLMSLAFPADLAAPARMTLRPERFAMDAWYLAPIAITDRLGAGFVWAIVLVAGAVLFAVPWTLAKERARVAEVEPQRCNACNQCSVDCPYEAIAMVPRTDGRAWPAQAQVLADKCVGCGICAGSCNTVAIGLSSFDAVDGRKRIDAWLQAAGGKELVIVLACGESAAAHLDIEADSGECAKLPDCRVLRVPCAGWIHAQMVQRALKRGAKAVLIVTCGPGGCRFREGGRWTIDRMAGDRKPSLSTTVDSTRVRVVGLFPGESAKLVNVAREIVNEPPAPGKTKSVAQWFVGSALALVCAGITWAGTKIVYAAPVEPPRLVVSFKHPGQTAQQCRPVTEDEIRARPAHMRPKEICTRQRATVRMRIFVDGKELTNRSYEPHGIWKDGNSIAIERFALTEGEHRVRVEIGDTPKLDEWNHASEQIVTMAPRHDAVVIFDKRTGFRWHPEPTKSE